MYESLLQDVRAWVLLATSLPPDRVVPVDAAGTRRALPYITVGLTTYDIEVGTDETLYEVDDQDELRARVSGDRRATVTLNAYGARGADLLGLCGLSLSMPIVQQFLEQKYIGLLPLTGTQDITQLVDTTREKRFFRDFELTYGIEHLQSEPVPAMDEFTMNTELDSDPDFNDPLTVTVEVD
jgi:hypothetical protein